MSPKFRILVITGQWEKARQNEGGIYGSFQTRGNNPYLNPINRHVVLVLLLRTSFNIFNILLNNFYIKQSISNFTIWGLFLHVDASEYMDCTAHHKILYFFSSQVPYVTQNAHQHRSKAPPLGLCFQTQGRENTRFQTSC